MAAPDLPMEYKEQIRDFHPKRDQMNKIHRWRYITKEDNLIAKVILIDGIKKDDPLEDAVCEKIIDHVDDDWTDMNVRVMYSMKKHRRWELPNFLEIFLPRYEDGYQNPLPVTGTSLAQFTSYRTHGYSPRCWYRYDMRYYGKHVKNLTVLDRQGERQDYPGGMNKGNIGDIVRSLETEDEANSPTFHVQFQTLEFQMVPRKHNSRKFDYRSGRCRYDKDPIFNRFILREECEPLCGCFHTCLECQGHMFWIDWQNDYEYDDEQYLYVRRSSFKNMSTFGDCFNVNNIPQESRCKKRDLKDWVLV